LRPWLLSALVASRRGDAAGNAALAATIDVVTPTDGMRDLAIARDCLDSPAPAPAACMVLP
ncbi:MAG: hypothetical protein WBW61_09600, partial [Rhodanobacteraceae bacterium]